MSLNFLRYGADVEIDIGPFQSFYMLEFPQTGSVDLRLGTQHIKTRPGCATVISPTLPVWSNWSSDCAQVMVKIPRSAMESHLSGLIGRSLPYELIFEPVLDFSEPGADSVLRFCSFLFDQFGEGSPILASQGMSRDLERAFMSALLMAQPNNYSDILKARSNSIAPRHVRKAIAYIEANLENDIALEALVATADVSARALYAGFHKFVGMPPQVLIRNLRLDRVRDDLLNAAGGVTVSEIAMKWHFTHLGRFSCEYKKRFNESPRDTLRW